MVGEAPSKAVEAEHLFVPSAVPSRRTTEVLLTNPALTASRDRTPRLPTIQRSNRVLPEMPSERFGRRVRVRLEALRQLAPPSRKLEWSDVAAIDWERFWWATRGCDRGALLQVLVRALDEVPAEKLERVLRDHFQPGAMGAKRDDTHTSLLIEVIKFCELAESGHFHEVIPYRGSEQSRATEEFVARFNAALDRCMAERGSASPADLRIAIEKLMDLSRKIDACQEEIVSFTDEGGSWQVGAAWDRVLPIYFKSVAETATEGEYRNAIERALRDFGGHGLFPRAELRLIADERWQSRQGT